MVVETLETVTYKMRNKTRIENDATLKKQFHFAFSCCLEVSQSDHLMKVDKDGTNYFAECLKDNVAVNLQDKHLGWFNQVNADIQCTQYVTLKSIAIAINSCEQAEHIMQGPTLVLTDLMSLSASVAT